MATGSIHDLIIKRNRQPNGTTSYRALERNVHIDKVIACILKGNASGRCGFDKAKCLVDSLSRPNKVSILFFIGDIQVVAGFNLCCFRIEYVSVSFNFFNKKRCSSEETVVRVACNVLCIQC